RLDVDRGHERAPSWAVVVGRVTGARLPTGGGGALGEVPQVLAPELGGLVAGEVAADLLVGGLGDALALGEVLGLPQALRGLGGGVGHERGAAVVHREVGPAGVL